VTHPLTSLSAYLDGELSLEDRGLVEAHLGECGACRAERDRLAGALKLLARLPPPPDLSPAFEQRFYARLAAERAPRRAGFFERFGWRLLAPGLAGVAASAALVFVVVHRKASSDDAFLAEHVELFESYEAVASVGAVDSPEDVEVVSHLDELGGPR
jgi:anti-sigma factor RsiW